MLKSEKKILRKNLKHLRDSLNNRERDIANLAICRHLADLNDIMRAETIAAYMPIDNEVDLSSFFAKFAEKRFCFPRLKNDADNNESPYEMAVIPESTFGKNQIHDFFTNGKFGICEPGTRCQTISKDNIDVWLIPGLGFDPEGNRLGRGGGFYDRLLKNTSALKIGIGYDVQLVDKLPHGEHDQQMNIIVTPKGVIRVRDKIWSDAE